MFEMMNQQALSVGAQRRREVATQTMREARRDASNGLPRAVGAALVAVGRRVAGEMPAARRSAQRSGDHV
ncbi:MAG: hypothetical protein OEW24_00980 [Chloroflexota bacterium]|nr:hypothetical protein [Chloroflexota bacterium]